MIKKIIACADIHFKNSADEIADLEEICELFYKKCEEEIEKAGGKEYVRIVVAGDLFDAKVDASNEALVGAHRFLTRLSELATVIIIAGNHDMLMNNTEKTDSVDTIIMLADNKNVIYLDKVLDYKSGCYVDDNVIWCLYSSYDGFNRPNIEQMAAEYPNKTLVGVIHADLAGAITDTGFPCENGLNLNIFNDISFVIAGHIHRHQEFRHNGTVISYCGSLKQKDFGENVSNHGYDLWDVKRGEYNHVEIKNIYTPMYCFSVSDASDFDNDLEILENQ